MKSTLSPDDLDVLHSRLQLVGPDSAQQLEAALALVQRLDHQVALEGPEAIVAFGEFGLVVRMTHLFSRVTRAFGTRRRRAVTNEIREAVCDIAIWAILFLTLSKGGSK